MTGMTIELLKWVWDTKREVEQRCRFHAGYMKNREKRIADQRTYAIEHHDEIVAYFKDYNPKRKGYRDEWEHAHAVRHAVYYAGHKDVIEAQRVERNRRNRDEVNEKSRAYRQTPKGKLIVKCANARTKATRRALGPIDMKGFAAKCADFQWVCQLCGKILTPETVTIDHIVPVVKGGTNALENLQPLCMHCNSLKRDKPMSVVVGSQYLFD